MRTRRRCGGRLTCTPCGVRCIGRCTGALRSRRSWRWSEGGQAGARERGSAGARSATVAEGFGECCRGRLGIRLCFAAGGMARRPAPVDTAAAGSGVARPGHSGGGGVEAVPGRGVRGAGRASGGEAAGPQLRTRWRRRDPLLGYCRDGGGFGYLRWAGRRCGRGRGGRRRAGDGSAPAAARPQGDHLRPGFAAQHDLEHRGGAVVPLHGVGQPGRPFRPALRARRPPRVSPLPEPGRDPSMGSAGSTTTSRAKGPRGPGATLHESGTSTPNGRNSRATNTPSPPVTRAAWRPCSSSRTGTCGPFCGTFGLRGVRWWWARSPMWRNWPRWPSR